MPQYESTFDGHDLAEELRPSELFTLAEGHKDDWSVDDRDDFVEPEIEGTLPHPVLDRQHGEIRVLNENVVQVFTDQDIYHELVEWLDEVFEIPVSYNVFWVDIQPPDKRSTIDPHALIVLDVDDGTKAFWPDDDAPTLRHDYQRGSYSGETAFGFVQDGGIVVNHELVTSKPLSPTESAEKADRSIRGDDASSGKNGWTWWRLTGTDVELADLRR